MTASAAKRLRLRVLSYDLSVVRQKPENRLPPWIDWGWHLVSVTKTPDELSIVVQTEYVPEEAIAERGWRGFMIEGPLDFGLTGVLASVTAPLAEAGISVFAFSTYDTAYILVKKDRMEDARATLEGHFDIAG